MSVEVVSLFPPGEDETGKLQAVKCTECGLEADIWISRKVPPPEDGRYAVCPKCSHHMHWNPAGTRILGKVSGPGVSGTKYGEKRRRELIRRNENLKKKQWDHHEPTKVPEGRVVRNPTEGGPYDPNGPFAKKKKNTTRFLPK